LFILLSLSENNIEELVKTATALRPSDRFFKLLEIPLSPVQPPQQQEARKGKLVTEVEMNGIALPEYLAFLILRHLSSFADLYNVMQVNSSFEALINHNPNNMLLWNALGARVLHPDDLPSRSSGQGAENGEKEEAGGDGGEKSWQAFFRQMKSSRMVLVMKIREGSPEDIEALILDVRVAGKRIVKAHAFTDWRADDEEVHKFLVAHPGYID